MINLDNTVNPMISEQHPNLKSILRQPTNWQLEPIDTEPRISSKSVTFKIEE